MSETVNSYLLCLKEKIKARLCSGTQSSIPLLSQSHAFSWYHVDGSPLFSLLRLAPIDSM